MEVKDLLSKTFGLPANTPGPNQPANVFGGIQTPEARVPKNQAFDASLLAQAQNTFGGGSHSQGSPQPNQEPGTNTPQKGVVGNLIPPGWSSQAAK